ncbi:MAG: bifunctional nuclease family protein [Planctomycetes bacterium]|nr:bifunctional nuclease family protein [Planctomycetota bacterium]
MIPVRLSRILISETSEQQVIWLREISGERGFPIVIGFFEAAAIDRNVKEIRPPRPLTHDLLARVIEGLGSELERIEITALKESTFYATLVLSRNGDEVRIDSRPSDAIALAAGTGAPILVSEEVMSAAAQTT